MVAKVLSFELADKKISDLTDEPDSKSTAIVPISFKLAYTFAGSRTELFLGTEAGDLLSFDTVSRWGLRRRSAHSACFRPDCCLAGRSGGGRPPT